MKAGQVFMLVTRILMFRIILVISLAITLVPNKLMAAGSGLSDKPLPYLADDQLVKRAAPLLEIGDPFLQTGNLHPGYRLPTGAVWQPRLWVYGTGRSAIQYWKNESNTEQSEWVNRLDLFANLQLSGTERILLGLQPIHEGNAFTGIQIKNGNQNSEGIENYNAKVQTLFFEGDIAELFPGWDKNDFKANDLGFSIGRQPLFFQDGFIINDRIDALGLTRNNLRFSGIPWLVSLRVTGVYAWDNIHRDDNQESQQTQLFGLFSQWDTIVSTFNADVVYVDVSDNEDDNLWVLGFDAIQRIGLLNTTFRLTASYAPDSISLEADNGVLLFTEISWVPPYTYNNVYFNAYLGIDEYRSAARDVLAGGPLGRTGILFAAQGLGGFPSPLSNRADQSFGFALGYQMFFDSQRRQFLLEAGSRISQKNSSANLNAAADLDQYGLGLRYQQALGNRFVISSDAFVTQNENDDISQGVRAEFLVKF